MLGDSHHNRQIPRHCFGKSPTLERWSEIRCYDYMNHPYERVRDTLTQNALAVFQSVTKAAASRAQWAAAQLQVDFGGVWSEDRY